MRSAILATAMLALTACSGNEPADDGERANLVESQPAFDPGVDSESAPGEDGRRWSYKTASQSALYGPPDENGMLTLRCDSGDGDGENAQQSGKKVLFNWITPGAIAGEERVLELRSGGATERAEVTGIESDLGGGAMWQARLDPEATQAGLLLETEYPISLRLDDGAEYSLRVPATEQLRQVIRDCRAPGKAGE